MVGGDEGYGGVGAAKGMGKTETSEGEQQKGRDLRNRGGPLPHCWGEGALLESEQGLLRLISHA